MDNVSLYYNIGTEMIAVTIDRDALDGKYIIGPDATSYASEPVALDELPQWYSPYDLNGEAPPNARTTWNNLIVLSLSSVRIHRGHLEALGYRPWSKINRSGASPPRHRVTTAALTPETVSASRLPPIFPYLGDDRPVALRDLHDWGDLTSWLCSIGPSDQIQNSPTYVAPFELRAIIENGRVITFGQMAALGYFRWRDAGFVESLWGSLPHWPVTRIMLGDIERRLNTRWAQAESILQTEAALAPPPPLGQSYRPPSQASSRLAGAAGFTVEPPAVPPPRPRLSTRRFSPPAQERAGESAPNPTPPTTALPQAALPALRSTAPGARTEDELSRTSAVGNTAVRAEPQSADPKYADKDWLLETFGPAGLTKYETVEQFGKLLQIFIDASTPTNGVESLLIWEITTAEWEIRRLKRAHAPALEFGERSALIQALGGEYNGLDLDGNRRSLQFNQQFSSQDPQEHASLDASLRQNGSSLAKVEQAGIIHALPTLRAIEAITASCVFRRNAAINTLRRGREPATHRLLLGVKILPSTDIIPE